MSVSRRTIDESESIISSLELPPPTTKHWVARRKAQVVCAVEAGVLTVDDALARYRLTLEELICWQRALYRHGVRGLQVRYLQIAKKIDADQQRPQRRLPLRSAAS